MNVEYIGHGIYTFSEASKLTGIHVNTLRAWFLGTTSRQPLGIGDYADAPSGEHIISFLDLIDVLIVGKLRQTGVSLQYLRRIREELIREFETAHPFSCARLLTDGKRVFVHLADEYGEEELKDILTRQQAFPEILTPYLEQIDYNPQTQLAHCWHITSGVVLDPGRSFGKPIIDSAGIPSSILASAFRANDEDADLVADWYSVTAEEVRSAVDFESWLLGATAA